MRVPRKPHTIKGPWALERVGHGKGQVHPNRTSPPHNAASKASIPSAMREKRALLSICATFHAWRLVCGGEAPVEVGEALRQLRHLPEDGIAAWPEHLGQVAGAVAVDGEAKEGDPLHTRLHHGLVRILDAVDAVIPILVIRLPIR